MKTFRFILFTAMLYCHHSYADNCTKKETIESSEEFDFSEENLISIEELPKSFYESNCRILYKIENAVSNRRTRSDTLFFIKKVDASEVIYSWISDDIHFAERLSVDKNDLKFNFGALECVANKSKSIRCHSNYTTSGKSRETYTYYKLKSLIR